MKGKSTYLDWDTSFIPILMSQSLLLPKLMNFKKRWRFISFSTSLQASKLRWFEKTQTSTSSPAHERPWMIKEDYGRPWKTMGNHGRHFHTTSTCLSHFHTTSTHSHFHNLLVVGVVQPNASLLSAVYRFGTLKCTSVHCGAFIRALPIFFFDSLLYE